MPQTDTTLSFGYWLRRQRQALDLTQAVLARRVGCATVTIQKIERDERRPSRRMAERLADALAVDASARLHFVAVALGERSVGHLQLSEHPVDPTHTRGAHNLPAAPTPFFGRQLELAQIATRLADADCHLLTIVGPGGIGKTRLAVAAASQHAADFADGACFVPLTAVTQGALLADEILRALDVPSPSFAWVQLVETLRDREMLLVLDNFEQLVDTAGLLADLLDAAPKLKLLVTSRTRLNLKAEWLIPLQGLDIPPVPVTEPTMYLAEETPLPVDWARLETYSAVQLFLHVMRRLDPNVALTPTAATAIPRLCRLVDGNPLAIELAAGWTRTLSPGDVLADVERGLDLLATAQRDTPERHRSMRVVFDHTWTLLTPNEQSILRQLAVFRGGFTSAAAAAVAGAGVADLAALVDKSWLRMYPNDRGTMHELVRQNCERDYAAVSGENAATVRDRFGLYITTYMRQQTSRMGFHNDVAVALANELGNLQAVWEWVLQRGTAEAGEDLVISLFFIGEMLGWLQPVLEIFATVRPRLAAQLASDSDPERRAVAGAILSRIEYSCAQLYRRPGLLSEADAAVVRLQKLVEAGVTAPAMAHLVLGYFGIRAFFQGRWKEARQWHAAMLDAVTTHSIMYTSLTRASDFWAAICHANMAWAALAEGDYPAAHANYRRALALRQQIGDMRYLGNNLAMLAMLLNIEGDVTAAHTFAQQAVQICTSYGDQIGLALARTTLGQVHAAMGEFDTAQALFYDALTMGRRSGQLRTILESLTELGRLELARGKVATARGHFDDALAAFAKLNEPHSNFVIGAWLGLGWVALAEQKWDTAQRRFLQTATATGAAAWQMLDAAAGLAEMCVSQGRLQDAVALLGLVAASPPTAAFTRRRVMETAARLGLTLSNSPLVDWRAELDTHLARLATPAPH